MSICVMHDKMSYVSVLCSTLSSTVGQFSHIYASVCLSTYVQVSPIHRPWSGPARASLTHSLTHSLTRAPRAHEGAGTRGGPWGRRPVTSHLAFRTPVPLGFLDCQGFSCFFSNGRVLSYHGARNFCRIAAASPHELQRSVASKQSKNLELEGDSSCLTGKHRTDLLQVKVEMTMRH